MEQAPYYQKLLEAFAQPGCALCRLGNDAADRYLDATLWELVNDFKLRAELNQARGYCQIHGWMLVRSGGAIGTTILMQGVTKTLLDVLAGSPLTAMPNSTWQSLLRSLDSRRPQAATANLVSELSPQAPCPVCVQVAEVERLAIASLLAHLTGRDALVDAYTTSAGLCLPHFRQTLAAAPAGTALETLLTAKQAIWQQLHAELTEFIRKNDYNVKEETYGAEEDAWLRALAAVCGTRPGGDSGRQGLTQSRR